MAQIVIEKSGTTHTLPYPSGYNEPEEVKIATHISYGGFRHKDKRLNNVGSVRFVQMRWQDINRDTLTVIQAAHRDLQLGDLWDYTNPAGEEAQIRINQDLPELNVVRYAGLNGEVLYTARWNLIMETG